MSFVKGLRGIAKGVASLNLFPNGVGNGYSLDECRGYLDNNKYLDGLTPETQKGRQEAQKRAQYWRNPR